MRRNVVNPTVDEPQNIFCLVAFRTLPVVEAQAGVETPAVFVFRQIYGLENTQGTNRQIPC